MKRQYDDFLNGHHGLVFEIVLESGEPLIVTVGEDNTIIAAFPDRRRVYRHSVPSEGVELYALASCSEFAISHGIPGLLVLSGRDDGPAYIWHLENSESSQWVLP